MTGYPDGEQCNSRNRKQKVTSPRQPATRNTIKATRNQVRKEKKATARKLEELVV
jgi:hypothetical protein